MAHVTVEDGRVIHEVIVWGDVKASLPVLKVKLTGAKRDDARVLAAVHFNNATCTTLRSIRYADLEDCMIPSTALSWAWVPPQIEGCNVIGFLENVKLTVKLYNKQKEQNTHVWVCDDLYGNVDMLLGTEVGQAFGLLIEMHEKGLDVKLS